MSYFIKLTAAGFAFVAFNVALISWYRKRSGRSIAHLCGPPSCSWLLGNLPDFQRSEDAATVDFEWTKKYGNAFRVKGCFGEDILYVADPKALQYILNTGGYNFPKTWESLFRLRLVAGRGLIALEGPSHVRQRRVMSPSFSSPALKGYLPMFVDISRRMVAIWKATILERNEEEVIIDVYPLLARTTLDALGEAAFGYKFEAIESVKPKTELHKTYKDIFIDAYYLASDFTLLFMRTLAYGPLSLIEMITLLPIDHFQRLRNYMDAARNVAKSIVNKELNAHAHGKEGGKDIMSIFVRANNAEDPKRRLEENEILSQITTLLVAGHETTASTMSWALYELSKRPDVQSKIRDEIAATRFDMAARGESEFTVSTLKSMDYTIAVVKETLRYHPIAVELCRRAARDDVIPLVTPLRTKSGETITSIPVRKGQVLQVGLAAYNRLPEVWGQDADQWRPERFLEEVPTEGRTNLGVYGNIATFGSGVRICVGWRFALYEMQIVLIDLIETFGFTPAPNVEMRRVLSGPMQAMVKGQEHKGTQVPLTVSILPRHDAH